MNNEDFANLIDKLNRLSILLFEEVPLSTGTINVSDRLLYWVVPRYRVFESCITESIVWHTAIQLLKNLFECQNDRWTIFDDKICFYNEADRTMFLLKYVE